MFSAIFIFVANCFVFLNADILHGYGNNKFAVKTPYFWTHPQKTFMPNELYTLRHNGDICHAIQLNFISRHAARYNEPDVMDSFSTLQNKIKSSYANSNYSFISTWVNNYPKSKANTVTKLGFQEMTYLGAKYGNALLSLFTSHLDTVKVRSSHVQRTSTSGSAFMDGVRIGIGSGSPLNITPVVDDRIMLFYDGCTKYATKVLGNKTLLQEKYEFRNSTMFRNMIRQDYYTRLYGHPVIAAMTCPLVEDVFKSMDNAIHNYKANKSNKSKLPSALYRNRYPVADVRFGHSPTIGPFLAALGLFKDSQPPTARNFAAMKNRLFSVNTVVPFSANIGFILYDCGNGLPDDQLVRLYVNEEPMVIPACGSVTCNYSDVRRYYSSMVDKCNWDDVCKNVNFLPPNIVG
ncbi:hypothetical protein FSP39_015213 [Pinctada imbricata]|uniref:Multiple inositol polyphosphate phosphatase 1 n=1 Tax=Pinctada imbricata TaxID=66713 RepID=A0AA88Y529_PINIB|nr:hypothetical protein FSP39_015213 [Pinctada imbricata]